MEATEIRPFAVVTGASSGIGYELAKVFAGNGFDLLINSEDHRLEEAKRTLASNGTRLRPYVPTFPSRRGSRSSTNGFRGPVGRSTHSPSTPESVRAATSSATPISNRSSS